jgi:hypothetical protein
MPNKILQMNLSSVLESLYELTGNDYYHVSTCELSSYSNRELIALYKKYKYALDLMERDVYSNTVIVEPKDYYVETINNGYSLRNIDNRQNSFYRNGRQFK